MANRRAGALAQRPSEWALRELPARAVTFLHAAGTHAGIRAAMARGGYGAADHDEGLSLVAAACTYRTNGLDSEADAMARSAATALYDWARTHLPRLEAAVERLHPNATSLFAGRDTSDERHAVLALGTLLDRLNQLDTNTEHAAVLVTLARRGLNDEERERLLSLVRQAQRAAEPSAAGSVVTGATDGILSPTAMPDPPLVELYCWYSDWSVTARTFVERKDWLGRMGLGSRRRGKRIET